MRPIVKISMSVTVIHVSMVQHVLMGKITTLVSVHLATQAGVVILTSMNACCICVRTMERKYAGL